MAATRRWLPWRALRLRMGNWPWRVGRKMRWVMRASLSRPGPGGKPVAANLRQCAGGDAGRKIRPIRSTRRVESRPLSAIPIKAMWPIASGGSGALPPTPLATLKSCTKLHGNFQQIVMIEQNILSKSFDPTFFKSWSGGHWGMKSPNNYILAFITGLIKSFAQRPNGLPSGANRNNQRLFNVGRSSIPIHYPERS